MSSVDSETLQLAQQLWDYHRLGQPLQRADAILALGSNDPRVAEHAAELALADWAPLLVCSGAVGALTEGLYDQSEGGHFAAIARARGVPDQRILIEDRATNTGENIANCRSLLAAQGITLERAIIVQKPYMERRSHATAAKVWPEVEWIISSPPFTLEQAARSHLPLARVIDILVGDLQRIRDYPAKGFQTSQVIPESVWTAWEALVERGHRSHLL